MLRSEVLFFEHGAQRQRIGGAIVFAKQRRLERVEPGKFGVRLHVRAVGDVVGGAREAIEREDRRAMPRRNQSRSDGKVLVLVPLALRNFRDCAHGFLAACTLPFHSPPRPRMCCQPESMVNAT